MAMGLMPAILFLVALGLAFATGTSWGTFSILVPIAMAIFGGQDSQILVISVAAILAGADVYKRQEKTDRLSAL